MTNLDTSLFKINMPTEAPRQGALLVAEPFLREDYFNHAVIALVEYQEHGTAMGLVLNKPTQYTLGQAIEGIHDEVDIPLYCGGPLSHDRLFYIHTLGEHLPGATPLGPLPTPNPLSSTSTNAFHLPSEPLATTPQLYIGGDFDAMKSYVNMGLPTEGRIRFFVGYSGWDPLQLASEISRHVWAVIPDPSPSTILTDSNDALWYSTVRSMGPAYRNWLYHPLNPQYN